MSIDEASKGPRLCLATVTTDSFVPGTMVMIYSFLKHHPLFSGDIVIIQDDLTIENQAHLSALYKNVRFIDAGNDLVERVDTIIKELPDFKKKRSRFYSLEAFRQTDYDKVVFCDSDLLFLGSIEQLLDLPHPLIACGDRFHYQGTPREWGVKESLNPNLKKKTALYHETFNAGLMILDRSIVKKDTYAGLLDLIDPGIYRNHHSELTDQMILNIFFSGKQHLVDAKYNYLLLHREIIYEKVGLSMSDAHILHFNGSVKPWMVARLISSSQRDPAYIRATKYWFDAYLECLEELFLNNRLNGG